MSAHGLKITNFHYTNTVMSSFEPTVYPKWVYPEPMSKKGQLVNDEAEEAAYFKALENKEELPKEVIIPPLSVAEASVVLAGQNDEREILMTIAKEKNIKVDARWKTDRIRATIERETKDL